MLELVTTQTADGIKLHGAWYSTDAVTTLPMDAVLLLHGTGSNFYSSSLWQGLIPQLNAVGLAVLAVNTRGHDLATPTYANGQRRMIGAAYESIDECTLDVRAWLNWLVNDRSQTQNILLGHSMGGLKAVYSQGLDPHPSVARLVAVSPPRLACSVFSNSPQGPQFQSDLARAQALIASGQGETLIDVNFPIPYLITAAGYVDKYGPEERYDLLNLAPRVKTPQLYTFGALELPGPAFRGVPDQLEALAGSGPIQVEILSGADHIYSGCHSELAARIINWLQEKPA